MVALLPSLAFAEKYPDSLKSLTLFFSTYFADDEEKKQKRIKSYRIIKEISRNSPKHQTNLQGLNLTLQVLL